MKVTKVGLRGLVFSFEDPYLINIYAIIGDEHLFICDTGFGSDTVDEILSYLKEQSLLSKPIIVFNSHADYDHVWGNHKFKNSTIIAHELSPSIFEKEGKDMLELNSSHKRGEVILTPPNKLFKEKLVFQEEDIEFYHTPGHTLESSSCYDRRDKILFVGDNIENPFPYINFPNLEEYKTTLEEYLTRNVTVLLSGHDKIMYDTNLIKENLDYLKQLENGTVDRSDFTKKHRRIHFLNVTSLGEMMKKTNEIEKAKTYYKEALKILNELEPTQEIEEKIVEISNILNELK